MTKPLTKMVEEGKKKQGLQGEQFQLISDEIKVLHSIFCGKDEILVNGNPPDETVDVICNDLVTGTIKSLLVSVQVLCEIPVQLNVTLNNNYPYFLPEISLLSSDITRKKLNGFQKELIDYTRIQCSDNEPIVLKLVNWLQENVPVLSKAVEISPLTKEMTSDKDHNLGAKKMIAILQFDHMRARKKYLKSISRWMKDLHLNGCILFFGKDIIGIVEGEKCNIGKYLKYLRTTTVDVDSAGKCCKERKMDLICELEKTKQHRIDDGFTAVNCASSEEFVATFEKMELSDVYQNYIYKH